MRAAIYVRQSLDRAGDGAAVARQREDCTALVTARGWSVAGVYEDNDVSASKRKPRAAYQRMLADVEAGRVDAVVAWASDRLHRRLDDLLGFVAVVEGRGTAVATVKSGDLDLSTPHGRLVARILGSVAQGEVEQKGERQRRANRQRAEAGAPRFSRRPYGYSADGAQLDVTEAGVLRQAARDVLGGTSLRHVVAGLNAAGEVTSTGSSWTVTTLRRLLVNPRMAGRNTYQGTDIGAGEWAAVLDPSTHEALVALLTNPARRLSPSNARKYLLSGMLICGKCGEKMYASSAQTPNGRAWMIYRCRTQHLGRRLDLVDEVVVAAVLARLSLPDARGLLVDDRGEDAAKLRAESAALRARLDAAAGMFAAGEISAAQLRTITADLRARLDGVEARQPATTRADVLGDLVRAEDLAAAWHALPLSRRRAVVDCLLTATVLPVGKGARFAPEQVQMVWK